MTNVLVMGAGQVGLCVAVLLAQDQNYNITLVDQTFSSLAKSATESTEGIRLHLQDVTQLEALQSWAAVENFQVVCCCLPHHLSVKMAQLAANLECHYFDLTEDRQASDTIRGMTCAGQRVVMTQCGLAPGLVNLVAASLIREHPDIDTLEIRTGAIPQKPVSVLQHACSWSVAGLVNEYLNPSAWIENYKLQEGPSLSHLAAVEVRGQNFEVFTTSGGVGSLLSSFESRVANLIYKTLRHPGHCQQMRFLLDDLKLRHHRKLLMQVLLQAMPALPNDQVVVDVVGYNTTNNTTVARYTKIFKPKTIGGIRWLAIQWTTAASVVAMIDLVLRNAMGKTGVILQEEVIFQDWLQSRFGQFFQVEE